jgi:hypothetical protein
MLNLKMMETEQNLEMMETEQNLEMMETTQNVKIGTAGSRNEAGTIRNWDKEGFTLIKSGSELISNAIDAHSKNIYFKIKDDKYIDLIDDGNGMTYEQLRYMFDVNRENHASDKSMGVAGTGGIISSFQLSKDDNNNPTPVEVNTHSHNGKYYKAIVPFNKIYETKKYDDNVDIFEIKDVNEIKLFNKDRTNSEKTGTTIRFKYSEKFHNLLKTQFVEKYENIEEFKYWWSCIIGKFKTNIIFDEGNGMPSIYLQKYNYFSGLKTEFYIGKSQHIIYCIEPDKFVTPNPENPNEYLEIKKIGQDRHSTSLTVAKFNKTNIDSYPSFSITFGMRKHNDIFNCNIDLPPSEITAQFHLNSYEKDFVLIDNNVENYKDFTYETSIVRNNQRVGGYTINPKKTKNSRSNGAMLTETSYIRSEIEYDVLSTQDNVLDKLFKIQKNKNTLDLSESNLPKSLVRLFEQLKEINVKNHMNYFKKVNEVKREKERLKKEQIERERLEREKEEKERLEKEQYEEEDDEEEEEDDEEDDEDGDDNGEKVEKKVVQEVVQKVEKKVVQEVVQEIEKEESIQGTVQIEDFEEENRIVQSQEEIEFSLSLQYEKEAISLITSQINNPLYKSKNGEELLNMIKKFYKI